MDTPPLPASLHGETAAGELLSHRHRWSRLGWPLVIATAGSLATLAALWTMHPSWQRVEKWQRLPMWWTVGVGASFGLALAFWAFQRRHILHTARHLDTHLSAKNRLETVAALGPATNPVARAQREETARFLREAAAPVRPRNRLLQLLALLLILAAFAQVATLLVWTRPWVRPAAPVPKPTPAPAIPSASLTWKSPAAETKAASVEEVPLEALANSTSGLRDVTLQISVNGDQRMSVPISLDALHKPGKVPIQTSMYMDQLAVQPYNMVSYYLQAKRIATGDLPLTVSQVQFVEVRPFRDDVQERPGGSGDELFPLITAMKVAQLRLLKENFFLAHAEIGKDQPVWLAENKRVGDEQALLGKKAGEVIAKFIKLGIPVQIIDLLTQAQTLMGQSAQKIQATQNQPAVPLQGKSLALITEIEKYFVKIVAKGGSVEKTAPHVKDPFEKQKDLELKQRFQTLAGELELLAAEQARLAGDLGKAKDAGADPAKTAPPDLSGTDAKNPNKIDGTFTERQAQISQRIGALLNGKDFDPSVTGHLEKGHDHSMESLRQLDADDVPKAREPAAATAMELRLAREAMLKAGDDKAKDQLMEALRTLSKAASQAAGAPQQKSDQEAKDAAQQAAEKVAEARKKLEEAAKKQQETGSAQAAARLAAAAKALNDQKLLDELKKLHDQPRDAAQAAAVAKMLALVSDQIAGLSAGDKKTPEEIAELLERVERSRANLARMADEAASGHELGASGKEPGASGKEPGASGKEPGASGKEPGASGKEPGASGKEPGASGKEPGASGKEPGASGKEPGASGKEPGAPGKEPGAPGKGMMASGTTPGDSPGQGLVASGTSQEKGNDSAPGQAPAPGDGEGSGSGKTGSGGMNTQTEEFAQEVMQDIREETQEAHAVLPPSKELDDLDKVTTEFSPSGRGFRHLAVKFKEIQPPLDAIIGLLRAKLQGTQRQHELTDQSAEKAPPAYREAVADYFERLSRDYKTQSQSGTAVENPE